MLATSLNVLFPGHNHLLTTGTDDPLSAGAQAVIKVSGHQYQWLAGGYDLEIGHGGYLVDSGFFVQCAASYLRTLGSHNLICEGNDDIASLLEKW